MRLVKFVISTLFIAMVGLVAVLAVSLLSFTFYHRKNFPKEKITKDYQYLRINRLKNESHRGITTQSEISDPHGFISYSNQNEAESYILISEFGSVEYECSGKCFCEGISRRSSLTFSRSITYLVAAISSMLAINHAKDYFEDRCQKEMSDSCEENNILSQVDYCDEIVYPHREKEFSGEFEQSLKKTFKEGTRIFWCKGNCLPNIYEQDIPMNPDLFGIYDNDVMQTIGYLEKKKAKEFGCEKLYHEGEVWIDIEEMREEKPFLYRSEKYTRRVARRVFMEDYLEDFCVKNSIREGSWTFCDDFDCEKYLLHYNSVSVDKMEFDMERYEKAEQDCIENCEHGKWNTLPMCVSHDNNKRGRNEDVDNKNVVCIKMDLKTRLYLEQVSKKKKEEESVPKKGKMY